MMVRYFGEMHISNFPKMKKLQIVCIFYKKHFTNEDYWYIMTISGTEYSHSITFSQVLRANTHNIKTHIFPKGRDIYEKTYAQQKRFYAR